jgi:UDP-N-acetylglucosamine 3-dehydrogenase
MADSSPSAERGALRGLIVGLGVMGSHHLRILDSWPEVELIATVEQDDLRREAALRLHPGVRGYKSLEQALGEHELDFACLAVPVGALAACTGEALNAGLHVFVEKPMAPSEEQAREMTDAAAERELMLGVGYVERFNPAVVALKRRLQAGAIGRIVQMHARRLSPFPNRDGMAGVALDLATHDIDLMRDLSGSEIERVSAESVGSGERSEDLICAVMRFDSGATGLLEANWITPTKVRELSVLGEGGMFVVNYLTQDLTFYEHPTKATEWDQLAGMHGGAEGDMVRYALERREPLRMQWEAFIEAVRRGGPAPVDGSDGLATLSTALAIRTAGVEHRVVTPSYREATRA